MKTGLKFMAIVPVLLVTSSFGQIKHLKETKVKIDGNCGMCEKTIEAAAMVKKISKADWDKTTKMAVLTYDSTQTNADQILKRIALAGYDNEKYIAPDEAYTNLPECCQYTRTRKKQK